MIIISRFYAELKLSSIQSFLTDNVAPLETPDMLKNTFQQQSGVTIISAMIMRVTVIITIIFTSCTYKQAVLGVVLNPTAGGWEPSDYIVSRAGKVTVKKMQPWVEVLVISQNTVQVHSETADSTASSYTSNGVLSDLIVSYRPRTPFEGER